MVRNPNGRDAGIIEEPAGSGHWFVRIYHRGHRYKRRATSKAHARELREEIRVAIRRGEWPPKVRQQVVLFAALLNDYREAKRRDGKAVMASGIGYARLLTRFGGWRPEDITSAEVDRWRRDLVDTMAPATVNLHLCLLRAILRHAVRNRKLEASALPEITALKTNNKLVRYLTEDEEARLVAALSEHLRPLIVVAIHTGLRKGELLKLHWTEVDFVSATIHVREAKSGEGRRLPLSATARTALMAMRERRRQRLRARVVDRNEASGYVFTAEHGGFLMNLNREWSHALARAGIEGLRFHDLRHTFASRLVISGVDLYRVQTLMGHKTSAMTLRYAHLSPQHLRAAVELLDVPGPKPWSMPAEAR